MNDFATRLKRVAEQVDAHPALELIDLEFGQPAEPDAVREAMRAIGMGTVDEDVVDFYTRHDGVYLTWGLKGKHCEPIEQGAGPYYGQSPGCVNILPFERVFSPHWQEEYASSATSQEFWETIYGEQVPDQLPETRTVVFDAFTDFYHTDIVLGPKLAFFKSSDYGVCYQPSDFVTLPQYLEIVTTRFAAAPYSAMWDRAFRDHRPMHWLEEVSPGPTLDEVITKLES